MDFMAESWDARGIALGSRELREHTRTDSSQDGLRKRVGSGARRLLRRSERLASGDEHGPGRKVDGS
jgi:hypothetical protein